MFCGDWLVLRSDKGEEDEEESEGFGNSDSKRKQFERCGLVESDQRWCFVDIPEVIKATSSSASVDIR